MTAFRAFKHKQVQSGLLRRNVKQVHFASAFRTQEDRLNVVRSIERVVHGGDRASIVRESSYRAYSSDSTGPIPHK
jgi:hypothetical protein